MKSFATLGLFGALLRCAFAAPLQARERVLVLTDIENEPDDDQFDVAGKPE